MQDYRQQHSVNSTHADFSTLVRDMCGFVSNCQSHLYAESAALQSHIYVFSNKWTLTRDLCSLNDSTVTHCQQTRSRNHSNEQEEAGWHQNTELQQRWTVSNRMKGWWQKRYRRDTANQQRDDKPNLAAKARSSALFRHNDPLKTVLEEEEELSLTDGSAAQRWYWFITDMSICSSVSSDWITGTDFRDHVHQVRVTQRAKVTLSDSSSSSCQGQAPATKQEVCISFIFIWQCGSCRSCSGSTQQTD